MADIKLLKNKFLSVASTGAYSKFGPAELHDYFEELDGFLLVNSDSLDSIELFDLLEFQFYLSILTNHDIKAKTLLERISDQFDANKSQRIKLMHSIYFEAIGKQKEAIDLLTQNPDELRLSRRLTTFSRNTNGKGNAEYINNLNYYLNLQPSDLMTWAELGDEYHKIGHYDKAIFCFKEILLQEPNAYIMFFKVGLNYYYQFLQEQTTKSDKKEQKIELMKLLKNARDNFLRAIEIYDGHSKSWVGVRIICTHKFNDKLKSISSKEANTYLKENEKLIPICLKITKANDGELDEALKL